MRAGLEFDQRRPHDGLGDSLARGLDSVDTYRRNGRRRFVHGFALRSRTRRSLPYSTSRSAYAACPRLKPPSFGGTFTLNHSRAPNSATRRSKSRAFWKTPPETTTRSALYASATATTALATAK